MAGKMSNSIFPGAEGWPFPKYLGSCGRLFVSTSITPLTAFFSSPPEIAADLACQLLQIINYLSSNDLNYFFYFTHIDSGTLGTFSDGHLFIRDTSRLGIIDMQQGKSNITRKNEQSDIFSCLSSGCPSSFPSCDSVSEKQNLVLVCKDLLPHFLSGKFPQTTQQKIDRYLRDCTDNLLGDLEARKTTNKLMEILNPWRTCDARFAYRYPDCKYTNKH
ncbi:hypothetical protein FKM82_008675 [Ascaphus truei]